MFDGGFFVPKAREKAGEGVLTRYWIQWIAAAFMTIAAWNFGAEPAAGEAFKDYRPYPCLKGNVCALGATYDEAGKTIDDQVYVISSGDEDTTYQYMVSGRKTPFSCSNSDCQVQPALLPEDLGGFEACALTDGRCSPSMGSHQFRVARFGGATTPDEADGPYFEGGWIYQYVSSEFSCTAANFNGVNADAVNKGADQPRCQISKNSIKAAPGAVWTTCAGSETICKFPSVGSYLVRYGVGSPGPDRFIYRVVSGTKINCNLAAFGHDPAFGVYKRCDYLELPKIANVSGAWEVVGVCENCTNVTYNLVTGVVQGNTKSHDSSWSLELSQEASVSGGVEGFGKASAKVEGGVTWSGRSMISDSFTKDESTTLTVTCDLGKLWQWVTSVQNYCMPNAGSAADCVTVARSRMYQCLRPGESPGTQPLSLVTDGTATTGKDKLMTTSKACVNKWKEIAGGELIIPSARAAQALNVEEYVVDPDGNYQISYRNWTFLCPSIVGGQ